MLMAASLSLVGWSCGKSLTERATESLVEHAINSESNGQTNLDLNKGEMTFTGKDGSKVAYGSDLSIPSDFPKEIPIYTNSKVQATSMSGNQALISLQSPDTAGVIVSWYESQLIAAGWKQESSLNMENFASRSYTKGNQTMALTVTGNGGQDGGTIISVQLTTEAAASSDTTTEQHGS